MLNTSAHTKREAEPSFQNFFQCKKKFSRRGPWLNGPLNVPMKAWYRVL